MRSSLLVGFGDNDVTLRMRWWINPPRHFELQRGLDTVLLQVARSDARGADARFGTAATDREGKPVT